MKHFKKLSCLLLLAVLLLFPPNGSSCGPYFPDAVFTYQKRPGAPLNSYAQGHLGVVLPTFTRSYLLIAYRYLAGRPLSQSEREGAVSYWRWSYENTWREDSKEEDPVQEWLAARKRAAGAETTAKDIPTYQRDLGGYGGYENCLADSFHTAALTLTDRARRFGSDRAAVAEWVKGQDMVFSDCDRADKVIPPALPENSPAWLKADRQYQIAAAHFYSRSFDQAMQMFDGIASDSSSPWHGIAPYLAARSMIRKGTLPDTLGEESLRNAEARLTKIINDQAASNLHDAARHLLEYIAFRIRPDQRNAELAKSLAGPQADRNFEQDIIDYGWSLDHLTSNQPQSGTPESANKLQSWAQESEQRLAHVRGANELTDWLMTFEEPGALSRGHAIERWRKLHSLPWLLAALAKIDASDKAAAELLGAAEQVPAASPAYPTLLHHRVRLLIQAGKSEKARGLLEEFLSSPQPQLTASSRNLFLSQRMRLAESFDDFLAHASRPVVDVDFGDGEFDSCDAKTCNDVLYGKTVKNNPVLRFDREAALTLNLRLPVELLAQSAIGTQLPEPLRGEVAVAAWTRAALLTRHDVAATLVPEMERAYPIMKDQLEGYLAANPEEKKQAALFVILHFPGMRPYVNAGAARTTKIEKIDNYRDNWWCADVGGAADQINFEKDVSLSSKDRNYGVPKDAPGAPAFLSAEQSKSAVSEWALLSGLGAGSSYLTRQILAWAQEHPQDPRLAEALHYAIRSTRYGCADAKVSSLSQKAFRLLHEKYPNSKWTKQTPYWY
jgi:hypothetical protein